MHIYKRKRIQAGESITKENDNRCSLAVFELIVRMVYLVIESVDMQSTNLS